MERRRMAAIFLGTSIFLIGAYVFINRDGGALQTGAIQKEGLFSTEDSAMENQKSGMIDEWTAFFSEGDTSGASEDKKNLTINIARATFDQLKALDQQGKSPFDATNTNTQEVQTAIESSIGGSVDSFFEHITVSDGDIKISANNTKEARMKYSEDFQTALMRHPATKELENVKGGVQGLVERACTADDGGISKNISDIYIATAEDIMTVRVPSSFVDFHKKVIEHYRKGSQIFTAIANCTSDPVKGFVAAQKLASFGMEAATIQDMAVVIKNSLK